VTRENDAVRVVVKRQQRDKEGAREGRADKRGRLLVGAGHDKATNEQ
jgi:hypothetical protein